TFPLYVKAMVEGGPRITSGIAWALTSSRGYSPGLLLEALGTKGVSKSALLDVINAQRQRLSSRELLGAAYNQEANEKAGLFRIIADMADEAAVPELVSRLQGKDPIARMHIINILSRFKMPEVRRALHEQLGDGNRMIRAATLTALAKLEGPIELPRICAMLRDPEIDVQNRAIDLLIRANDPETIKYLIDVLKDENENARRAAVEVLNEVGDAKSVKYLLGAIKDDDWWVRSRAGDALGKIGGPKVIDAVLHLIRDKDDDIRRSAIEILNQTKDERAVNHLIDATRDADWWVSERAVDALAEIGSRRALPRLQEMLQSSGPRSLPIVVRAIGKLGDHRSVDAVLPLMTRSEPEIRVEAMRALAQLTDERRADQIRSQIQSQLGQADHLVSHAATTALSELDKRFAAGASGAPTMPSNTHATSATRSPPTMASPTAAMPYVPPAEADHRPSPTEQLPPGKLDISTLRSGDIVEGRYKYIERIGKGAFGTVLLMEDTVVDERLILKFLNPNVSEDEEMMKRFVHELRYSRKITHPNVIRIYDFLQIQGIYAISM
ncbi:serine/threonine protein kinase, partial [bacterium]